jgi:hypothetical protein
MAHIASPPQPQSDPEKHRDRMVAWRAALLSAAVVLMAGFVGSASSYIVASKQIESQASQSQLEFLRTQRQSLYSEFLSRSANLYAVMSAHMPSDEAMLSMTPPLLGEEQIEGLWRGFAEVQESFFQISLMANLEAQEYARAMLHALHVGYTYSTRAYCHAYPDAKQPYCAPNSMTPDFGDKAAGTGIFYAFPSTEARFIEAAREEIQIE